MMQTQKQKVENGTSYSRAGTARPNAQSTCEGISDCHLWTFQLPVDFIPPELKKINGTRLQI